MSSIPNNKEQLLKCAIYLFEKKGYSQTSVQDIVERAGVTKGSFYYYFKAKDDLLFIIHDQFIEYELEQVRKVNNMTWDSYTEKLNEMILANWKSIALYRKHMAIYLHERKFIQGEKFNIIKKKRDEFEGYFVSVLEEGIKHGEFNSDINPKIITFSLLGMAGWAIYWYQPSGNLSIEEIAEMHQGFIIKGISRQKKTQLSKKLT